MLDDSLLAKHFSHFLAGISGLFGERKRHFQQLVSSLVAQLEMGSSCIEVGTEDIRLLEQTKVVTVVSDINIFPHTPLVLHGKKLYLQRYFVYESRLASQLKKCVQWQEPLQVVAELLDQTFFETLAAGEVNYQRQAAQQALLSPFLIVSGGPGTGKTTTVVRILSLLAHAADRKLEIALAAPTGKAAQRLYSSIVEGSENLPETLKGEVRDWLPPQALTLHRLLGVRLHSTTFRHNAVNPMQWDVVVVDEASMVDLAMMSKLVDALKPGARLILLGDKDQLASVESGTVLSTVVQGLPQNSVVLKKSYRFNKDIKEVADAVNQGDGEQAFHLLQKEGRGDSWQMMVEERYGAYLYVACESTYKHAGQVFDLFRKFMVLCATRKGNRGVEGVNRLVERRLARHGFGVVENSWYAGRPLLMTRNDYNLGLYNGDIGICLPDEKGLLKVWFEDGAEYKGIAPAALSSHETVYGMTVHKSQGSEFSEVVLMLPTEDSQVLCRELIYTGITRAKDKVHLVAEQSVFVGAVYRYNQRQSGLAEMLLSC